MSLWAASWCAVGCGLGFLWTKYTNGRVNAEGSILDWYVAGSGVVVSTSSWSGISCTELTIDWVVITLLSWDVVL